MEFPEEFFLNILVRLPIKDIFRCKGVCKSWFNLISDPYFTNFYARNSPYSILFRAHENGIDSINSFSLLEVREKGELTQMPVTLKLPVGFHIRTTVIGSWDSSVFLLHRKWYNDHEIDRVYLFNPVSGSCFKVTEDYRVETTRFKMEYKVGYIPSNSTYKLFRYITYRASNIDPDSYKNDALKILTVGLDKNWRNMDESLRHVLWKQELCLNGSYHWVSQDCEGIVCTFDLLEEKNGAGIPIPHGVSSRVSLTKLHSCLCVIDQADDDTMVIWSMKEYGVIESWSKVTILTFRNPYPKFRNEPYFLPVAVFPNGNILFTENLSDGIFIFSYEEKQMSDQIECMDPDPEQPSYTRYVNTYAPRFYTLGEELKLEDDN